MKKTILIGILVILGIGGLVWWGRSTQSGGVSQTSAVGSALSSSVTSYNFGTISMKNGLVSHVFKLTNSADTSVHIKKIATSCMCTSAYLQSSSGEKGPFGMEGMGYLPPVNETIPTGESRELKVVYDPNAHGPAGVGPIERFISLTDSAGRTLELEIKAVVTP